MDKSCSFPDCTSKHHSYGYCRQHRRQQLAGVPLMPLPGRPPSTRGQTCPVLDCGRAVYAKGICKAHYGQQHRGQPFRVLDNAKSATERWALLSAEERKARMAPLHEAIRSRPRTEEHARRLSESLRARYAKTPLTLPPSRVCRGCSEEFKPNSGSHFFCEVACRALTSRLKRFGLSREDWNRLAAAQDGRCALCGHRERGWNFGVGLVIDHCHKSGRARGLLCGDCNTAIGRFGDDPARLRAAADYLDRYAQ